jgi:acyl-CoA synthetase (NDP forming)
LLTKNEDRGMSETNGGSILEPDAIQLLTQHHIPYPEHGVASSAKEAVTIADRLGYPVVLKIVSPDASHKSDVGGVVLGVKDAEQVRTGYADIVGAVRTSVPTARVEGVLVCQQAPPGLDVIVGALHDMTFGPTVMFGMGGIFAEVLRDVTFRIAPLERRDAAEMIQEIKGYSLLTGARGQTARDVDALTRLLLTLSNLITQRPDIKELDLNPVRLFGQGLMVLDIRLLTKPRPGNR